MNNYQESDDTEKEKTNQFKEEIIKYYNTRHGQESFKNPIISGRELNLYKLYKEVTKRGGFQVVCETKQWKDVVGTLDLPSSCTSASFTVRNHYNRYLLDYEKDNRKTSLEFNSTNVRLSNNALMNQVINNNSNIINNHNTNLVNNINTSNITSRNQILNQPSPSQEQKFIGKKVNRVDLDLNFFFRNPITKPLNPKEKFYNKNIRMLSAILDLKRVELAFESHLTSEIYWAINTLLIFSTSMNVNIYIENQPYLMESITNYIYYCVNNISELHFIINIIEGKKVEKHEKLKEIWKIKVNKNNNNKSISRNSSSSTLYKNKNKNVNNQNIGISSNLRSNTRSLRENSNNSKNLNNYNSNNDNIIPLHHNNVPENKGNFKFMDGTNHTMNLSSLMNNNKDLLELDKEKKSILLEENTENENVNVQYEEITEYELNEHLISLIQIIRNLSYTTANEGTIFKNTKFMNILYLLFIHSNINDIVSNALDIINNLSKHILLKDCPYSSLLMFKLFKILTSTFQEMSEHALECFRRLTLPNGNESYFEKMPDEFLNEIVNLLISPKNDIRDSALEILYCLSDQDIMTKTKLGKIDKCIPRLIGLICSNSNNNRISKFAACVLSKLAEIPQILKEIMPYEKELFVAASIDNNLTKVLLEIISN